MANTLPPYNSNIGYIKMNDKTIVVWFSCGAASAVAAKLTIEKYGKENTIKLVNNPIANEHHDNQRFLKDCEKWLGHEIESCINPDWPSTDCEDVWAKRKFMSSTHGAPCTYELKKKARQHWEANNHHDYMVLGFTSEEQHRAGRFRMSERENLLTPLIDEKYTKSHCFTEIMNAGILLPEVYRLGYPNANCIGCVKATSPTYWNHVRTVHPEVFASRATQSREIGAKLVRVKNQRIFLDELKTTDLGRPMKSMDFECGIFCEER